MSKFVTYVSTDEVRARKVTNKEGETVVTFAGSTHVAAGDYVVETSAGNICIIEKDIFEKAYRAKQTRKAPAKKAAAKKTATKKSAKQTLGSVGKRK